MKDRLFPEIPSDLSDLTVEELTEHRDALRASAEQVVENASDPAAHKEVFENEDGVAKFAPSEIVEEMTAAAEAVARIDDELAVRAAGEQEYVNEVTAAAEKFGLTAADGEDDDDDDGADPEVTAEAVAEVVAEAEIVTAEAAVETPVAEAVVEAVAEPVVAAAPQRPALRKPRIVPAAAPSSHRPLVDSASLAPALVASAGIEGTAEGAILDREGFGNAMMEKRRRMVSTPRGVREEVIVASVNYPTDEARTLRENDIEGNMFKIKSALDAAAAGGDQEALAASGGLCAPLTPYYDLAQVAVAARPVRDSLMGFNASRGGVIVGTPATIADITTAITHITAAQDEAGGSAATKGCQHIDCPPFTEVTVDVIARCLEIGNLTGRTYPELVAQWTELVMAAHARTAEGLMLDAIKGYSTAVAQAAQYGALSTMLAGILQARAGMISRHRMSSDARFQAWLPEWTAGLLVNDLENSQFDRFSYDLDGVTGLLRSRGITPTFYKDEASGDSQIFPAQGAGALETWPNTVAWGIAPVNSYMFVDGGTLDLGLVRDSVLNSTNDYQIFAETFENVAFIGVESLWITSTVCPSGTVANPATAITC